MLFNFCDSRLRPEIQCSTVSTEGHEVTNLISDSPKGFLAYSCIKPPINIDITFLCNVQINHILIWPYVGSQKSSGFQVYAKTSNDTDMPYTLLSTGYLSPSDSGILFYSPTVKHETIATPPNFLKRHFKGSMQYMTTYASKLRICICKTENSVPALGKVEVWGTVSPRCGKDVVACVHTLWCKDKSSISASSKKAENADPPVAAEKKREVSVSSLEVPECFLDPITWEIMTQPIMLPSGKIIDQTTLQKHEETEALWGRNLTDPFTGIPFSENRKPVVATALKMRIDKFLLDNSNAEEVKKLPRVLGRALPSITRENKILEMSKDSLKEKNTVIETKTKLQNNASGPKNKRHCHKLPVVVMCPRKSASISRPAKRPKITNSYALMSTSVETEESVNSEKAAVVTVENSSDVDINTFVPNLKRFNVKQEEQTVCTMTNSCDCCTNGTFYQLPCKHVICRKILLSIVNNQCTLCDTPYKTSEVKRIHE